MDIPEKVSKKKLIEFSGEHLYYEISMLYGVCRVLNEFKKIAKEDTDDVYHYNALLESFVIHASIITDFFYKQQALRGDAKAVHYMKRPKEWKKILPAHTDDFKKFNTKRNKDVVHLSYKRLEVTPEEKKWGSIQLTKQIEKIVDLFLDTADPELIHPRLYTLHSRNRQ